MIPPPITPAIRRGSKRIGSIQGLARGVLNVPPTAGQRQVVG